MLFQKRMSVSRRLVLAGMPAGVLSSAMAGTALGQPTAADPVSFYLGQVLALATLQAEAIRRLRPLLATPSSADATWQAGVAAEAGVIGAVASVLGAMEPPAELAGSVGELQLASAAYQAAAEAARGAADGDDVALADATTEFAEGAAHILLWLDALTAETGNDWGDGLRILTEAATPIVIEEAQEEPPAATPAASAAPEDEPAEDTAGNGQGQTQQNRQNRQDRQNQDNQQNQENQRNQQGQQDRQNRQNRQDQNAGNNQTTP